MRDGRAECQQNQRFLIAIAVVTYRTQQQSSHRQSHGYVVLSNCRRNAPTYACAHLLHCTAGNSSKLKRPSQPVVGAGMRNRTCTLSTPTSTTATMSTSKAVIGQGNTLSTKVVIPGESCWHKYWIDDTNTGTHFSVVLSLAICRGVHVHKFPCLLF